MLSFISNEEFHPSVTSFVQSAWFTRDLFGSRHLLGHEIRFTLFIPILGSHGFFLSPDLRGPSSLSSYLDDESNPDQRVY